MNIKSLPFYQILFPGALMNAPEVSRQKRADSISVEGILKYASNLQKMRNYQKIKV